MEQEHKRRSRGSLWAGLAAAACLLWACFSPLDAVAAGYEAAVTATPGCQRQLVPVGRAVGIKLFSDGVLVVGLSEVETSSGAKEPGRECGLKAGDLITHINGQDVDTIESVQALLAEEEGAPLTIRAQRGEKTLQLSATPAANLQGSYQLGVWLRDSMAGIGTMTFYDPDTGSFAALGHGINDVDTATLMPLESGSIMPATVGDVKKGQSGQPGELHGNFDLSRDLGDLYANTESGIFGTMDRQETYCSGQSIPVASRGEVEIGPATIRSNVRGDKVETFDIEITYLAPDDEASRALTIHVTDPELLTVTGGIVQGMSGSPILQNGKLVGAVTHVLVNDPTRGYGIFIENMLNAAR